jgi:DNA replication protein DnaC
MPTTRRTNNSKTTRKKITRKKTTPKSDPCHQRQRILEYLATLKAPLSSDQLDEIVAAAEREKLSALSLLERFLSIPANTRCERSIQRRIRNANFPTSASFENFDWEFNKRTIDRAEFEQLGTGEFVRRQDNLVFAGESGLGKSHLIQAIGRRCCTHGFRVRYVTSAGLLEDLSSAAGTKTLSTRVRYYGRFDLLIIDELGFEKLELREYPEAPSLLYKVIDHRNRRTSTALVTNIDFQDWTDYFGDAHLTMAMLDRTVDTAIICKFEGKSYRKHRAEQKQANRKQAGRPSSQGEPT